MKELTTTLNKLEEHYEDMFSSWEGLLFDLNKIGADDKPLRLETILKKSGISEAVWALRAVDGYDEALRRYSLNCALLVLPIFEKQYPDDKRPRQAIETAERFAKGQASEKELIDARKGAESACIFANRSLAWFVHEVAHETTKSAWGVITNMGSLCDSDEAANIIEDAVDAVKSVRARAATARRAAMTAWFVTFGFLSSKGLSMTASHVALNAEGATEGCDDVAAHFKREFIRLCRLEGEYGVVAAREREVPQ